MLFYFKGIKACEKGGLLHFIKRRTSSSLFVAEFAIFSSSTLTAEHLKSCLFVHSSWWKRKSYPFHIEWNDYEESWRVLFEVEDKIIYKLCYVDGDSNIGLNHFRINEDDHNLVLDMKQLMKKIILIIQEHPEACLFSPNLTHYAHNSLARYLNAILSGNYDFATKLSNFSTEKVKFPSLESCIASILNHFKEGGKGKEIENLSKQYFDQFYDLQDELLMFCDSCWTGCGFLAMCRLAHNGNKIAMELCEKFMTLSIGSFDCNLISSLALTGYSVSENHSLNMRLFLAEWSVLGQNREILNASERESLFSLVSSISLMKPGYFLKIPFYSNFFDTFSSTDEISNNLSEFRSLCRDSDYRYFGFKINQEIFFNAVILAKKGSKVCLDFFKFFVDNFRNSTLNSLHWSSVAPLPLESQYKLRELLLKHYSRLELRTSSLRSRCWFARQYITGIPDFLPVDQQRGFLELIHLFKTGDKLAPLSLGSLYFENVPGFEVDLEKALFFFSKHQNAKMVVEYIKSVGIKIEHKDSYFIQDSQ